MAKKKVNKTRNANGSRPQKKKSATSSFDKRLALLLKPCRTADELYKFIQYFFGLSLPNCTVSRYADTNPFDMIWRIYDICVNQNNPEAIKEILCVAGRGSGKTLGMAILELLVMLHDQRDACHVGAILSQAKRCYEYQVKFMLNDKIKPLIDPSHLHKDDKILQKMNMEKSSFIVNKQHVSLEVLPCTLKAVNGPHVPLVVVDEIDTVSGEGVKAFRDIQGMLDSRNGKEAIRVGISTRKSRYGLMNKQIENAEAEGRTVWKWTAFEFTQRCEDDRSGTLRKDYYVLQDEMEVLDEDTWAMKDKKKQKEYEKFTMYEKCGDCPIAAICLGDAKKQHSKSPMLKPITELIQKVRSEGADWALAQLMNLKPSVEGIIYKEFDEKIHVHDWDAMWEKLTGKEFPDGMECTHDIFVKKCQQMGLPCYGGIDWGWSNPSTVVYFYVDKRDNIYVVRADGMTFMSDPEWIHYIKMKYHSLYKCQMYFPDVANQGAIVEMRKAGLPAASDVDKAVPTGIQVIKKHLRVPGGGGTKMHIARETCAPLINEFSLYHFKTDAAGMITEDPEKEFDHWLDALRYPMTMLLGKSVMIGGEGLNINEEGITDNSGRYRKMPTAAEFAKEQNITFNEDVDTTKLGKIGTKEQLDDDDDDWNGGGGFLWSF